MSATKNVYLIKGTDEALASQACDETLERLFADVAYEVVLLDESATIDDIVVQCSSSSLFGTHQIIKVTAASRFKSADLKPLKQYLQTPASDSTLMMISGAKAVSSALVKLVSEAGEVIDASTPDKKNRLSWVGERINESGLNVDHAAIRMITERLGDELWRLDGILHALKAACRDDGQQPIGVDDISAIVSNHQEVLPWEITDSVEAGDIPGALEAVKLLMENRGMHPLAIFAILSKYVANIASLDGLRLSPEEAAKRLKIAVYPAKKIVASSRLLGPISIREMQFLMADAESDLKGARGWPPEYVLEVLVARLARLFRPASMSIGRNA